MIPALLITVDAVRSDPALEGRGTRKIVVTSLRGATEQEAASPFWQPSDKCPVLATKNLEVCVFNENVRQDRHFHQTGTEMYLPIEGTLVIEVEGADYMLGPGDMLVVNPGARHQVKPGGEFLCRVVIANCGGEADKYPA